MSSSVISLVNGRRNLAPHTSVVLGKKKGRERENASVTHHTRIITLIHRRDTCAAINDISAFTIFLMSPRFNYKKKNRTASLASWHMCNNWLRMMDKRHPSASLRLHSYT